MAEKAAVVYGWLSQGFFYLGFATRSRQRQIACGGVVYRWCEHFTARYRPTVHEGDRLRYRLARKYKAASPTFLVLQAGSEASAQVADGRQIRMARHLAGSGNRQQLAAREAA